MPDASVKPLAFDAKDTSRPTTPKTIMKTTRATRAVKPAKKAAKTKPPEAPTRGRNERQGTAIRPKVGARLRPSFSLPADSGGEVSLAGSQKGKWVVLYFYPRDNTPGCTREAIAFEGAAGALEAARRRRARREPRFRREPLRLQGQSRACAFRSSPTPTPKSTSSTERTATR